MNIKSMLLGLLLCSSYLAHSQDPTVKLIKDPTSDSTVIIYLEWPANASATASRITNTSELSVFFTEKAGSPTITSVQGTWAVGDSRDSTTVDGAGSNPDRLAYRNYRIGGPTDFGNVATAGTADTIFKLHFPNQGTGYYARVLECTAGVGASGLDAAFTGGGYVPTLTIRPNASSIFVAYDVTQTSSGVPLPVDLLSFEANLMNDKDVLVTWETASELNNDYFQVERIMEGEERFTSVGSLVPGAGTTSARQYYSLLDTEVSWISPNAYYRLLQVDYDGTISYSDLEVVSFGRDNRILLYPNPTTGEVNILMTSKEDTKITVSNVFGQDMTDQVKLRKSSNGVVVDMSGAALGTYFIHVTTETSNSTKKVVLVN
jgi:hypothetical protein